MMGAATERARLPRFSLVLGIEIGMTPARAVLLKSPWPRCFGHILNARFDTKYLTE